MHIKLDILVDKRTVSSKQLVTNWIIQRSQLVFIENFSEQKNSQIKFILKQIKIKVLLLVYF